MKYNLLFILTRPNPLYLIRAGPNRTKYKIAQQTNSPQDYLTNTQQYYYQVEWLKNISKFLLVARNGANNNITNESQICLIDTSGNITNSIIVDGGILREAKMAVKWSG